jgi:hypothetical protein
MRRARSHSRIAGFAAFGLLALVAEIAGRDLTVRFDLGRHVPTPSYAGADYYPFLLAGVKIAVALMLAGLTWRFVRARSAARASARLLSAVGARPVDAPRLRIELSLRSWLLSYGVTAGIYLVQTDSERIAVGHWPVMSPWLHTSALSVFAVLSVVVSLVYSAVARWLSEYERYAEAVAAAALSFVRRLRAAPLWHDRTESVSPRRLFGLAFECRPPPVTA